MIDITDYKLEKFLDLYNQNHYSLDPESFVSEISEISFPEGPLIKHQEVYIKNLDTKVPNFRCINFRFNNPKLAVDFYKRFEAGEDLLMKLGDVYLLLYEVDKLHHLISDDYKENLNGNWVYNHLLCEVTVKYNNILAVDKVAIRNLKLKSFF